MRRALLMQYFREVFVSKIEWIKFGSEAAHDILVSWVAASQEVWLDVRTQFERSDEGKVL
ncbi:hypothetical protein F9C07_2286947 [Aspergillus flavus]|uniref:Uncharacterized protein n=1 Tax=Aspergillus flavus (strain ATCC 200026 / FGSC A1120 / IAM 13836 / NRRL 3357 / JCM 12722 / SRRC 167) TaxID=332952 RepID=A0A7U2MYL8_ASPFN|nr:hypothetical protein F9C07_2286947 [Aspergillus flavus]